MKYDLPSGGGVLPDDGPARFPIVLEKGVGQQVNVLG
jgi:hypothetical protein